MNRSTAALAFGVLVLAGCASSGTTSTATTTTTAAPTPSATPTAAPTADDERVVLVKAGFGAYLETTFAGGLIHNTATAHTARQVNVHVEVTAGARHIGSTDVHLDALDPGATVPVGGRIQGSAATGESAVATITVGAWDDGATPAFVTAGAASFACSRCGAGAESGDVNVPITFATTAPSGLPLNLTAICTDGGGRIVGGGAQLYVPPAGARDGVTADVPAVVSAPPIDCVVGIAPVAV